MADADADDAPAATTAASLTPPPPPNPNPDAQTTVNDFLDYTEFYPADLARSLTLIGDLDAASADAVQHVHDLAALYCTRPDRSNDGSDGNTSNTSLTSHTIPHGHSHSHSHDAPALRRQMARQLQRALRHREYAHAEAARLYEVTLRHCARSSLIKRKLQAQPEPPSRDPTPPPVSPTAARRSYDRPRLHLTFDGARTHHAHHAHLAHHRQSAVPLPRGRARARARALSSSSSDASGDDGALDAPLAERSRKGHTNKDRPHKPRPRAPGVAGTNVHSSIAGISTSNALAKLSPPPPDARPGSKWAPWMKLTEYEMAVLRKQMKKNAVWTPSLTMVNRELERKHRTRGDYEREKARCLAAGVPLVDEEPETLLQIATAQGVDDPALTATAHAAEGLTAPAELSFARDDSVEGADGRRPDRDTRRQQAMRAVRALENATKTIQNAADGLKELTFSPHTVSTPPASATRKRSTVRSATNKRKRDATPLPATDYAADSSIGAEAAADKDTASPYPEPKRPRLQLIAPAPPPADRAPSTPALGSADATPQKRPSTPAGSFSVFQSSAPAPQESSSTVTIPLAPAGPSTPAVSKPNRLDMNEASGPTTPVHPSPLDPRRSSPVVPIPALQPTVAQPVRAASTRPRRGSVAVKNSSPPPQEPSNPGPSILLAPGRAASPEATIALRSRSSRGHIPTPKAQSEEPKPNEAGRPTRDTRRHSIFGQSALTAPGPTRTSSRRKPPPKGEISSAENGQKTVTNVKRSKGSKNARRKKPEGQSENVDDVDSDEERYCICDDVSYGQMVSCDNNCDKEWFHFECVGMTVMPARRAKWYCPDCREALGTDAFGNPKVPPSLPGRGGRGDRHR